MNATRPPTPRSRPSGRAATRRSGPGPARFSGTTGGRTPRPAAGRARGSAAVRTPLAAVLAVLLPLLTAACLTVSRQEEIEMGRDYADQINDELPLIDDPSIRDPVAELGHELARASPRSDLPYEFRVVNTNVINAFAVPGGFIYMNRGLIEASGEMSEVAGVMAHEVGHVVARHSAQQVERARRASLGLAVGSIVLGQPSGAAELGVNVAAGLYFAKHSREAEAEADQIAVDLMVDTGWHPCGLVDFFMTMLAVRESRPGALASIFASHPLTEDRIRDVERRIASLPRDRLADLRTDSPAYGPLVQTLASHPPPPEKYRVDEQREPEEGADGEGPDDIPDRTGVCAAR